MFEAYTTSTEIYELNDVVALTDIRFRDCRIVTPNTTSIRINAPGRYYVEFHALGASNTAASPFTVALYRNGVAIPGVVSTVTSTAAGDVQTMSLSTIVNVPPSNCYIDNEVNLTLVVTSAEPGTITSGNLVIFRLR